MDFTEFLEHDDEIIRRTATVLQELNESYEREALNEEEYQELLNDLMDLGKIDELADSIERKAAIQKVFEQLILLSKII